MKIRSPLTAVAAVALLMAAPAPTIAQDAVERAAESWLALVDAGDYRESWDAAATTFQAAITAEAWAGQLEGLRTQVGTIESRELADSQPMTNPPGAPPGEYVQLRYDVTTSAGGRVTEVVVLVQDGARGWRATGYFMQPAG